MTFTAKDLNELTGKLRESYNPTLICAPTALSKVEAAVAKRFDTLVIAESSKENDINPDLATPNNIKEFALSYMRENNIKPVSCECVVSRCGNLVGITLGI